MSGIRRRIAVVDRDRCSPKKCGLECIKYCPRVRSGIEETVQLAEEGLLVIDEDLCTGCGICVKVCPFGAITVVNLPTPIIGEEIHRYSRNGFVLYRLPIPRPGSVVGTVGPNGVGKTTVMRILAGELRPNLGDPSREANWNEVIDTFKGSELQHHFRRLADGEIRVSRKPERIGLIPKAVEGSVMEILEKVNQIGALGEMMQDLDLSGLMDREVRELSGGELQRLAIAATCLRDADLYVFDEPSNYLDVYQRMGVARVIGKLARPGRAVLISEHDLAILDYLSDYIHVLYGRPDVYGVVSFPHSTKDGINIFLEGYLAEDNVRFRDYTIKFIGRRADVSVEREPMVVYGDLMKQHDESFKLKVVKGEIGAGEVVVAVGPNGIGKTTFVKMLAGIEDLDDGQVMTEGLKISYKPQYLSSSYEGTVEELLRGVAGHSYTSSYFKTEIIHRLALEGLLDRRVDELSGGALQRIAIATTLGRDADVYLLDEPSAFLDVEMRLSAAKGIKRRVEGLEKSAIVVEHDLLIAESLADRMIVFSGRPGVEGIASRPKEVREAMNEFLKDVGVTIRRDPETGRPRVNKPGSKMDQLCRSTGNYYA